MDSRNCIFRAVRCVDRNLTNAYDKSLAGTGLKTTQFSMLSTIMRAGPISIGDLSLILELDQTTTTRNVSILEQNGWVARVPHADPRVKQIKITAEGKRMRDGAFDRWRKVQESLLSSVTQEEMETFRTVLSKLSIQSKELV